MSRKWYTLGLMIFAAACGGGEEAEIEELETIDTEETLPPVVPVDTTMMMGDTMMMDTMAGDTM